MWRCAYSQELNIFCYWFVYNNKIVLIAFGVGSLEREANCVSNVLSHRKICVQYESYVHIGPQMY